MLETLERAEKGTLEPVTQKDEESTYAKMLTKELGRLDFSWKAEKLERYVRGLNSWPSAYTEYKGKQLKIWRAEVLPHIDGEPGRIAKVTKDAVIVCTGKGALSLLEIQLEGKKRMSTKEFLLGRTFLEGEAL